MSIRISAALLVLLLASSFSLPAGGAGAGEGGAGGRQAILVHDVYELQNISLDLNASYALANDIDASATEGWNGGAGFQPIEDPVDGAQWSDQDERWTGAFNGALDGRGFRISNLHISVKGNGGLFRVLNASARVSDLSLDAVDIQAENITGGIAAVNYLGTVTGCHVSGIVAESNANGLPTGMLVGVNNGRIDRCWSEGSVRGYFYVGGLVGASCTRNDRWPDVVVSDSFSRADVATDVNSGYAGGLAGMNLGTVLNCYSTGPVSGKTPGGLVGYNNGTVISSYWDMDSSGIYNSDGGVGKTTAEMMAQAMYIGWRFDSIWEMAEGASLPVLRDWTGYSLEWQDAPKDAVITEGEAYCATVRAASDGKGGAITYGIQAIPGQPALFDDFNDGSLDAANWTKRAEGGVGVDEQGGAIVFRGAKTGGSYWEPQANISAAAGTTSISADLVSFDGYGTGYVTGILLYQDDTTHLVLSAVVDPGDWGTDRPIVQYGYRINDVWYHCGLGELGSLPLRLGIAYQGGTGYYYVNGKIVMSKVIAMTSTTYRFFGSARWPGDSVDASWDNVCGTEPGSLPDGLAIGSPDGTLSWPDAAAGNYSFEVTASDNWTAISSVVSLTVKEKTPPPPVNRPPEILSVKAPDNRTVGWDETLDLSVEARDPDDDVLTYEWRDNGITISRMSGFSRLFPAGDHTLEILVSDGNLTVTRTFNFTVFSQPANRPPEILSVSAPENLTVGWNDTVAISADATDPDGDGLTCEWQDNGVLISTEWSYFHRFEPGDHVLVLLVGDGHLFMTRTYNFTVARAPTVNRPPEIVRIIAPENRALGWNETLTIIVEAFDPDGDRLTYEWKYGNITIGNANTLSRGFIPGSHTLVLLIGDGEHTISRTFTYTVESPPQRVPVKPYSVPLFEIGIAAAVIVSVVTVGAILAAGVEVSKYWLLPIFLLPLYTRLNKEELLDNETRGMIRGCIISDPGIHYNEIQRRLNMGNGKAAYHLMALEREGIIKSRSDGRLRRFYPAEMRFDQAPIRLDRLQKLIFDFLREREGLTQREVASALGISTPTVSRNMKRMAELGVVRLERHGITIRCYITDGPRERSNPGSGSR